MSSNGEATYGVHSGGSDTEYQLSKALGRENQLREINRDLLAACEKAVGQVRSLSVAPGYATTRSQIISDLLRAKAEAA